MSIEKKPLPVRFNVDEVLSKVKQLNGEECVSLRMSRIEQANLLRAARTHNTLIVTRVEKHNERADANGRRGFNIWKKTA